MKKLLFILLLLFTLKSYSQTICDSVVVNGSNWQIAASVGTPGASIFMVDSWVTTDPLGSVLGQDIISSWDGVRWVKHYISVWPSGLYEVQPMYNNGKMYDLFGRELFVIPQNKVYIKNSRLYIEK